MTISVPENLKIAQAQLPETYEAAKVALAECRRIDECKTWADKAEALAAYARIADDDSLKKFADRIKARAVRRAGELLREYDARGAHMKKGGAPLSQREAAGNAGLSPDQQKQAVRVARVPDEDFESAVEDDIPATVTKLAGMGTKRRRLEGPDGRVA